MATRFPCPLCHGKGRITEWTGGKRKERMCPECDGNGWTVEAWWPSDPLPDGETPRPTPKAVRA